MFHPFQLLISQWLNFAKFCDTAISSDRNFFRILDQPPTVMGSISSNLLACRDERKGVPLFTQRSPFPRAQWERGVISTRARARLQRRINHPYVTNHHRYLNSCITFRTLGHFLSLHELQKPAPPRHAHVKERACKNMASGLSWG